MRCPPRKREHASATSGRVASRGSVRTEPSTTSTTLRGLVTDDGAAVFRGTSAVQLVQIAGGAPTSCCGTLRGFGNVRRPQRACRRSGRGRTADARCDGDRAPARDGAGALGGYTRGAMALRTVVTPFAWSQPHDVNEHVAGIAESFARSVTPSRIASSNRASSLPPDASRSTTGRSTTMGSSSSGLRCRSPPQPRGRARGRANEPLARTPFGRFDVVHGFEPGLPSLSYLALRDAESLAVATFFSPERLSYPPGRAQRERLLGRIDQLLAVSEDTAAAAAAASRARTGLSPRSRHDAVRARRTRSGGSCSSGARPSAR